MNDDVLPSAQIPSTELSGEAERRYVDRLLRILRAGRLNLYYPDSGRLRSHVRAMHPETHRGLYEGLEINVESGLPTYKEWTRVQTDVEISASELQKLGSRASLEAQARESEDPIHQKLLEKHRYYSDLRDTELAPLGSMDVQLRRVDTDENRAYFHVVLDKLDASGLFVRFSIDLAQKSSAWSEQVVRLDEDTAKHTEEFESLIYKFTSLDAEFTFAKLAGLGGLDVQMVAKGTVGPIFFAPEQAPGPLSDLLEEGDQPFVATFALDKVAGDIADTRDNDPLEPMVTDRMSPRAREVYQEARERFDYRAYKDRKFVVPRELVSAIRNFCEERGTKNIIYTPRR